ncbi:hypothetical protein ACHAWF_003987 [Thalassiosira exigua]
MDSPETVKFNVGGKPFETSRSLIDQHEGTMLARLVSDTWQEDPQKDMFMRDLDFYGILPEEGSVKSQSEGWASHINDRLKQIENIEEEKAKLEMEDDFDFLALYCAACYGSVEGGQVEVIRTNQMREFEARLWKVAKDLSMTRDKKTQSCLRSHSLGLGFAWTVVFGKLTPTSHMRSSPYLLWREVRLKGRCKIQITEACAKKERLM